MLVALAILSMGLALLLLISHNWDEIPRAVRMGALMLLTAGLNGQGIRCYAQGRADTGKRWLFAGGLAYGASIMLIAQIYHLGEHFPDGLFWWALGVVPVALLTQSRLLHLLQWSLATLWLFSEAQYGLALSYPLFLLALVWQLWRGEPSRLLVAALVSGTALWLHGSYVWWFDSVRYWYSLFSFHTGHIVVDVAIALLVYALSQALASRASQWWRDCAEWFNRWLLRAALVVLLALSFADNWDALLTHLKDASSAFWYLAVADVLVLLLVKWISLPRLVGVGLAALLANGLLLSAWLVGHGDYAFFYAVLVNLILLASGVRLILRGLEVHDVGLFYTGVVLILLLALMRYINLLGDYLSGALLFLFAGAVLFAAARFWRRRMREVQA